MEHLLDDPGLVENSADAEHCFHACIQMVARGLRIEMIPSFHQIDKLSGKKPGLYTWPFGVLNYLAEQGLKVEITQVFNVTEFLDDPKGYLVGSYGEEVGLDQFDKSDIPEVCVTIRLAFNNPKIRFNYRIPTFDDVKKSINSGLYAQCTVNQRIFQADPGYVGHSVLVFGYSERGLRLHNPGPPALKSTESSYDLFARAWGYPTERSRELYSIGR